MNPPATPSTICSVAVAGDGGRDRRVRRLAAGHHRQSQGAQHRGPVADRPTELGDAEVGAEVAEQARDQRRPTTFLVDRRDVRRVALRRRRSRTDLAEIEAGTGHRARHHVDRRGASRRRSRPRPTRRRSPPARGPRRCPVSAAGAPTRCCPGTSTLTGCIGSVVVGGEVVLARGSRLPPSAGRRPHDRARRRAAGSSRRGRSPPGTRRGRG